MMPPRCPHEMGQKEYWREAEIWSNISPHTYVAVMKISPLYTNWPGQHEKGEKTLKFAGLACPTN